MGMKTLVKVFYKLFISLFSPIYRKEEKMYRMCLKNYVLRGEKIYIKEVYNRFCHMQNDDIVIDVGSHIGCLAKHLFTY